MTKNRASGTQYVTKEMKRIEVKKNINVKDCKDEG